MHHVRSEDNRKAYELDLWLINQWRSSTKHIRFDGFEMRIIPVTHIFRRHIIQLSFKRKML